MRVLVTGAKGFVGRNLCCALENIRDGKDRRAKYQQLLPLEVMEYDIDSTPGELDAYCSRADFVFNLAGVNRPKDRAEFMEGNFGFASTLLETLERHGNTCPVMLSSSAQASLSGRFEGSVYGESKLAGEGLFREYSERTGAPVLIYRFPNLYGKWCRPRYNSAVATFCDAIANGRPYTVNDPSVELELLYIDDLVDEMLGALLGEEHRCGYEGLYRVDGDGFCYVPKTDVKTLGEIVYLLGTFRDSRETLSDFGVTAPEVILASDPALTLPAAERGRIDRILREHDMDPDGKYIGFVLRKWPGIEEKATVFAAGAVYAYLKYGLTPVFLSINFRTDGEASQLVTEHLSIPYHVLGEQMSTGEVIGVLSRMTAVVSMRLHGLIFAAGQGVPLIGVAYDPKVTAFLDYVEQNNYMQFEALNATDLSDLIDSAVALADRGEELRRRTELLNRQEDNNRATAARLLGKE